MSEDRYDEKVRSKRMEARRRQVRRRIMAVGALIIGIALIAGMIVWVGGKEFSGKKSSGKDGGTSEGRIQEGLDAIQDCYNSLQTARDPDAVREVSAGADRKESFAVWFQETYPEGIMAALKEVQGGKITEDALYKATGESMQVLYDRYNGSLDDAETAKAQGIYLKDGKEKDGAEIVVAGDLCFAEDGFVLDYYDTVNSLSECISPRILQISNEADIFYLNHEYAASDRGNPLEGKYYTFRASPSRMGLLAEMGTDIVSLANNHVYDYGPDAMFDTMDLLDTANISYVGGGRNGEEAVRPVYYVINGIKIGFVAATNAENIRFTPAAGMSTPGVLEAYDTTEYNRVIKDAARQCDFLIAYIHWGTEDTNDFNEVQQTTGKEFLDSGADIVVGGHPHVLQGIEYMEGKPVVYSMGDFWFNDETKYTGMLKLNIGKDGLQEMSFVPCRQTGYTTQYIEGEAEQAEFYQFLQGLSRDISIDANGVISNMRSDTE